MGALTHAKNVRPNESKESVIRRSLIPNIQSLEVRIA